MTTSFLTVVPVKAFVPTLPDEVHPVKSTLVNVSPEFLKAFEPMDVTLLVSETSAFRLYVFSRALEENPEITQIKLMEEFDLSRKQIQKIIKELRRKGVIIYNHQHKI